MSVLSKFFYLFGLQHAHFLFFIGYQPIGGNTILNVDAVSNENQRTMAANVSFVYENLNVNQPIVIIINYPMKVAVTLMNFNLNIN